jgi:predicted O-methyltransferase YrrM
MLDPILQIALQQALAQADGAIDYPVEYLAICRDCWSEQQLAIATVRAVATVPDALMPQRQRFNALLTALQQLPPLSAATTQTIAMVSDRYCRNTDPLESFGWFADVSTHFQLSSSFGKKGRILSTIVRYMRSQAGIELGSAYGMSAMFILETMQRLGQDYRLATLEGGEKQYALSSQLLKQHYGNHVSSYFGWTHEKLPQMVQEVGSADFLFHDAGHSREDYLRDVQMILPIMQAGAVAIIDDIYWDDQRFYDGDPRTHEGWLELAHHPRVLAAVEVDASLGLLLLGPPD